LLVGSNEKGAVLWNYETGESHKLTGDPVSAVAFGQTGKLMAVTLAKPRVAPEFAPLDGPAMTYGGSVVQVWNTADRTVAQTLETEGGEVSSLRFAPGDESLLLNTQSFGGTLFDAAQGTEVARFTGHAAPISHAAFMPDGRQLVTASWDETAMIWDAATGKRLRRLEGHKGPLTHCAISSDGRMIATASADTTCRLWNPAKKEPISVLTGHADQVWRVAFSADDRRLLTVSRDRSVRVWDRRSEQSTAVQENRGLISFAEFTPKNQGLLTVPGDEFQPRRLELAGGPPAYMLERVAPPRAAAPKSAYEVKLFKQLGEIPLKLHHVQPPRLGRLSPNGQYVLTVTAAGEAMLWNAANGKKVRTFALPVVPVRFAAFTRDGKRLLTDHQHELAVWDVKTGARVLSVSDANGFSFASSWTMEQPFDPISPDGRWLVTVSKAGEVRRWTLQPLAAARATAPRQLTDDEKTEFEISTLDGRASKR
jgi:WD40 repeat protein